MNRSHPEFFWVAVDIYQNFGYNTISFYNLMKNRESYTMDYKIKIDTLYNKIHEANDSYYNGTQIMTDEEFDSMMRELRKLEQQHPEIRSENSPTQTIGSDHARGFDVVRHEYPMRSMQDIFTFDELLNFVDKHKEKFVTEPKIDGLSLQLTYQSGKLLLAATRGNGIIGDNVTENAKRILDIPHQIPVKQKVVVRGEVYISKKDFEQLNENNQFANARNAAVGSLKSKDPEVVAQRKLRFLAFQFENAEEFGIYTHSESLKMLSQIGITVVPVLYEDVINAVMSIGEYRDRYPYCIDGAAIKIDDLKIQRQLGSSAKYPRWMVAFKYPAEVVNTTIRNVKYQIGRTGVITPVAIFDPISICDTTVERATLHNENFMSLLDMHEHDTISVSKAGDIIPQVVGITPAKDRGKRFLFPQNCPFCGSRLERRDTRWVCDNKNCTERRKRQLIYLVSKSGLDIKGYGEAIISQLVDRGHVWEMSDVFTVTKDTLLTLDGVGNGKATNIINAIRESKKQTLDRVICALGIDGVGPVIAKRLSESLQTLDSFSNATLPMLREIDNIGDCVANNTYSFLKDENNQEFLKFLKDFVVIDQNVMSSNKLSGKRFAITGTFEISRKDIANLIESSGGVVSGSVSKNCNYLIAGKNAGSKLKKAEELGVEIVSLEWLQKQLK